MNSDNNANPYVLTFCLLISSLFFSLLGGFWNEMHYHKNISFIDEPSLTVAMLGIHDGLLFSGSFDASCQPKAISVVSSSTKGSYLAEIIDDLNVGESGDGSDKILGFTKVSKDYFSDAVFIGDSRTVGICEYSGIDNATYLCRTSLSIYDFDKPKVTYNDETTSIADVLRHNKFGKIYLMVGINECGFGTPETFYEKYSDVIKRIRLMQPDAIIYIEGNLLVTDEESAKDTKITNENISARNELIATIANQTDIFYIDINESRLCENGSLKPEYTWDQVHIKAQYYDIWREFLMEHAVVR